MFEFTLWISVYLPSRIWVYLVVDFSLPSNVGMGLPCSGFQFTLQWISVYLAVFQFTFQRGFEFTLQYFSLPSKTGLSLPCSGFQFTFQRGFEFTLQWISVYLPTWISVYLKFKCDIMQFNWIHHWEVNWNLNATPKKLQCEGKLKSPPRAGNFCSVKVNRNLRPKDCKFLQCKGKLKSPPEGRIFFYSVKVNWKLRPTDGFFCSVKETEISARGRIIFYSVKVNRHF